MSINHIAIIGGGLCGLSSAYLLEKEGIATTIFEARDRLGGRIHTLRESDEAPIEMGATWLGKKHQHLCELLDELNIDIYEQFMGDKGFYEPMSTSPPQLVNLPPNEDPSYRIAGGSDNLIQALAEHLTQSHILLNRPVTSIVKRNEGVEIHTNDDTLKTDAVITTLPPKLLIESVSFNPPLPNKFQHIANQTHTWMAESIKVALTFAKPFWRQPNSSGTIFSNVGPINEMYDHSNGESHFALKGFMNDAYHSVSQKERKQLVLDQLRRFYSNKVDHYESYRETVWREESFSYASYDQHIIPHQNNGNPLFQKPYWNHRLLVSGSETASAFPGYMDGAVESSQRVIQQIKKITY